MKKSLAVILSVVSINAVAYQDKPFEDFDATKDAATAVRIVWIKAKDVDASCEAESVRRGNGGFGGKKQYGCAFWEPNHASCTIITPKTTNLAVLGHEVRHCFQGNFHQ
jgi:hypothetical protein